MEDKVIAKSTWDVLCNLGCYEINHTLGWHLKRGSLPVINIFMSFKLRDRLALEGRHI